MRYDVSTDIYEGPLSLLVELAKLNLLDLFIIKLQGLTAQYVELVKTSRSSINELAEPLPLLGQLLAMKARLLLPQPPPVEDEEEVPVSLEELQRRLREYEQFKTVPQALAELHSLQHDHLTRPRGEGADALADLGEGRGVSSEGVEAAARPIEVGIVDLMSAFARVLERAPALVYEVHTEPWTVEMKVEELKMQLALKRQIGFVELFSPEKPRLELVVIFLALLELMRQRVCSAVQERPFGEILIMRRDPALQTERAR